MVRILIVVLTLMAVRILTPILMRQMLRVGIEDVYFVRVLVVVRILITFTCTAVMARRHRRRMGKC